MAPQRTDELRSPLLDQAPPSEAPPHEEPPDGAPAPGTYSKASVVVLFLVSILDAIEYGIIMPSLWQYLEQIQSSASTHTYGLVVGSFSCSSMLMKPVLGYWTDRRPFKEVYVASILTAVLGSLMYACAGHWKAPWMLLGGRLLSGVGAANTGLGYAWVARAVPSAERTAVMTKLGMGMPLGLVLGPCTNLLTHWLDFSVGGFRVDQYNSPGLVVAAGLLALLAALVTLLKEPPQKISTNANAAASTDDNETVRGAVGHATRPRVLLCFLTIFAFNLFIASMESIVVPVTQHAFGFSPLQNSLVYCGIAVEVVAGSIAVLALSKRFSDSSLVLAGNVIFAMGVALICILWKFDMHLWQFLVGQLTTLAAIPLVFSPNRSRFSKLVEHSRYQGLLSSMMSIFSSIGSIAGPVWMGMSYGKVTEHGPVARTMFFGCLVINSLCLGSEIVAFVTSPRAPQVQVTEQDDPSHLHEQEP